MSNDKAFPLFIPEGNGANSYLQEGMTLRDYFAAKAMQSLVWIDCEISAKRCYEIADAMLEARK